MFDIENIQLDQIQHMEIDARKWQWTFNPIKTIEIINALEKDHRDDPTKSVEAFRGSLIGIFKIDADEYSSYVGTSIDIRGQTLNLTPRLKRDQQRRPIYSGRKRGTTVTIFGAYARSYRELGNELFDDYFENLDGYEVIGQTRPQYNSGTTCLNNHRQVRIVREDGSDDKIDIGSYIIVEGVRFNIIYDEMEKFCQICQRTHGKECPSKVRFEALKKLRQGKTLQCKIYSDSSLRSANQLALSTDVACMSGGGIGQIINAVPLDVKRDDVVIFAGNNEITNNDTLQEFVCRKQVKN